ncbi:MAG: activator of (R)-2-hydroxyglutaryl-CoA dehydratase [Acidobacteriota bacterium]|nr:MAG: activator of (R)-2-hydroxyglutaryl-CoA dehydratase [Acidobacteriota bacterium]
MERPFLKSERDRVTILTGGLSPRHDRFLRAAFEAMGCKTKLVPTPDKAAFQAGKEYGNNGQCSPTYFTVGALVNELKRLRDEERIATERILEDYVFVTMGACGPCRFGMYEAEYRLALRNSGFDGFRVVLFQIKGGLNQVPDGEEPGLPFNLDFFILFVNMIILGDLLNDVANQIRPYEVVPGQTDRVFEKIEQKLENQLRTTDLGQVRPGKLAHVLSKVTPVKSAQDAAKFMEQLFGERFVATARECANIIDEEIEVDFSRPKPVVKIVGEFWATLTEGDGNYRMHRFLTEHGAEPLSDGITTWVHFLLSQTRLFARDQLGMHAVGLKGIQRLKTRAKGELAYRKKDFALSLATKIVNREYERLRTALGGIAHEQVDQMELQRIGSPYYNSRGQGGESYMEVAKNIYYSANGHAHMVLSLKPFGCLPSTQSDGAQAAVISQYPDMIYLPIETSGEGDVNAHSRVQMALGEAKEKCRREFRACVAKTGFTIEEIRAFVADRPELRRALQSIPHEKGVTGRAAHFVLHVGRLMAREGQVDAPVGHEAKVGA